MPEHHGTGSVLSFGIASEPVPSDTIPFRIEREDMALERSKPAIPGRFGRHISMGSIAVGRMPPS
jgi:hypothetical protein